MKILDTCTYMYTYGRQCTFNLHMFNTYMYNVCRRLRLTSRLNRLHVHLYIEYMYMYKHCSAMIMNNVKNTFIKVHVSLHNIYMYMYLNNLNMYMQRTIILHVLFQVAKKKCVTHFDRERLQRHAVHETSI